MEVPLKEQFDRIFLHEETLESRLAQRAYDFFGAEKIVIVKEQPLSHSGGTLSSEEFDRSKRNLFITNFKGHFFKRCPGAKPGLTCCNYFVLNLGLQCNMNCSYCYLQSYINTPVMTVYANVAEALKEIEELALQYPDRNYRVGTGETTDSLSLDDFTLYSRDLISFFERFPKWTLEFKSKSAKVDQFLDLPHAGNVITSWSINPQYVIEREEHKTASLQERLQAARKCRDQGFKVTFHFDPMIWHDGWEKNYLELVEEITKTFSPREIPYITVGALRFVPEQRHMMRERFGFKSLITSAEVFPSRTGKLRYDNHVRNQMFQLVVQAFQEKSPDWRVSLCMETPETWVNTMSTSPRKMPEMNELFDPPQRARGEIG